MSHSCSISINNDVSLDFHSKKNDFLFVKKKKKNILTMYFDRWMISYLIENLNSNIEGASIHRRNDDCVFVLSDC
jgi:hypothetical protein